MSKELDLPWRFLLQVLVPVLNMERSKNRLWENGVYASCGGYQKKSKTRLQPNLKTNGFGLACTGILKTPHVGCGLTGHDFLSLTGVQENLTTIRARLKVAVRFGLPGVGTMYRAVCWDKIISAKWTVGSIPLLTKVSLQLTFMLETLCAASLIPFLIHREYSCK